MSPLKSQLELIAVESAGPRVLAAPPGVADVNEAFDQLALGAYEGLRTFDRVRLLGLEPHIDRLQRSVRALGWDYVLDRPLLRAALARRLEAWPTPEARVRFDVLAEPATALGTESRLLIALSPHAPVPDALIDAGVQVPLTRALVREAPKIKKARFVIERRSVPTRGTREDYEPILVGPDGRLLEGTSSNFFGVRAGGLVTAGEGVLEGITAGYVTGLATGLGVAVDPSGVAETDLAQLDEAFLCSSVRGVVPIVRIGETRVGNGTPGAITRRLLDGYWELAWREARPADEPG